MVRFDRLQDKVNKWNRRRLIKTQAQPFMDVGGAGSSNEIETMSMKLMRFVKNRSVLLIFVLCLAFLIMFISTGSLQLNAQASMSQQLDSGSLRQIPIKAARGEILDRNGVVLATSVDVNMLYWADASLNAADLNAVLLDLANTLDEYDIAYGEAIDSYLDLDNMEFAGTVEDMIYWQKNKNYLGLEELPEDVESDYRDKRYVKTTPQDFYDYLAYTRFSIDESYTKRQTMKIVRLRFQIYLNNWAFSQGTPVLIATDIPDELIHIFAEQNFRYQGAVTTVEPMRVYNEDAIYLSHIIGYVGQISAEQYAQSSKHGYSTDDIVGKAGIEAVAERYLHGNSGLGVYNIWGADGSDGAFVSELNHLSPQAGDDVILTIDMGIQRATNEALADLIEVYSNDASFVEFPDSTGAAVMIDLKDHGAVLAMASLPTYNPQDFLDMTNDKDAAARVERYLTDSDTIPMLNRAIARAKAPGSTFKVFTSVALLYNNVVTPYTIVDSEGSYEIDGMTFGDEAGAGLFDLNHAIAYSSNVYFYKNGIDLGIDLLSEMTARFGLNERTGIELYGESAGIHASRETKTLYNQDPSNQLWYPADTAQTAIGQGLTSTTVLQLARATGAVATGNLSRPFLIDEIQAVDGTVTMKTANETKSVGVSESVLQSVRDAMLLMTTDEFSTVRAHFETAEYLVAGKTGTAETIVGGYGETTDGVYIAFAPYDDPEVAVAVLVETGARGAATSQVARAMFDAYFADEEYTIGNVYALPGLVEEAEGDE